MDGPCDTSGPTPLIPSPPLAPQCEKYDKDCAAHAKTVTGYIARLTRNLFRSGEPPVEPSFVWDHIQCLQEYQARQLVPNPDPNPDPNPNPNPD